jgi:hypothetical protein
MLRPYDEARVDVLVHERVVEHDHVREPPVPRVVLERRRRRRAAIAIEDGTGRMQAARRRRSAIGIGSPGAEERRTAARVVLPLPAFGRLDVPLLSPQRYVNRIDQWTLEVHHGENSGGDPPLRRAFN